MKKKIYCNHCQSPLAQLKGKEFEPNMRGISKMVIKEGNGIIKCRTCSTLTSWEIEGKEVQFKIDYKGTSKDLIG